MKFSLGTLKLSFHLDFFYSYSRALSLNVSCGCIRFKNLEISGQPSSYHTCSWLFQCQKPRFFQVLNRVLSNCERNSQLVTVKVNGFVHTTDKLAVKHFAKQINEQISDKVAELEIDDCNEEEDIPSVELFVLILPLFCNYALLWRLEIPVCSTTVWRA